jgi:hypothetical protein
MTEIEYYIENNTEIEPEDLSLYFTCKRYKGKYFAQMKKEAVKHLRLMGMTHMQIAPIVGYAQHSMISHVLNTHVDIEKDNLNIIRENWQAWVRKGLYPKTGRDSYGYTEIKLVTKEEL